MIICYIKPLCETVRTDFGRNCEYEELHGPKPQ